jgi:hypothetical protein
MKPQTKFVNNISPFTGARSDLVVTNDPPPQSSKPGGKYDPVFASMKPGQAVACSEEDLDRVAEALRHWIKKKGLQDRLRSSQSRRYSRPEKGSLTARVWLLEKTSQN